MVQKFHTSCDYRWVYAYGLFALRLLGCPVAKSDFQSQEPRISNLTILATLGPPPDLVSATPNWSRAVLRPD